MCKRLLQRGVAFLFFIFAGLTAFSQTTTVYCTGTSGSYKSGGVTSAGVRTDGNMLVTTSASRGWAVFDLSSVTIPAGASITAVSISFSYTTSTGGTSVTCNLYGYPGDLSAVTGTTLYSSCVTGSTFQNTNWGANNTATPVTVTKVLNSTGISFVQSNISNTISIGFVTSSGSNQYTLTGYGGTSTTQPQLVITYASGCSGQPVAGTAISSAATVCPGASFTISSTGSTTGPGISYQWQSSPAGQNTWANIAAATATSYTVTGGQAAAMDYRAYISCANSTLGDTTNVVPVGLNAASFPEDFSSSTFPPCGWSISTTTYLLHPTPSGYGIGSGSVEFNFFSASAGTNLDLTSFTFTPVVAGAVLSFDEAYTTYTGNQMDNLLIQTSTDGGVNYTTLTTFTGGNTGTLTTATPTTSNYSPAATEWSTKYVLLPAGVNRVRLRGASAFGNNLYVDNINVLAPATCPFPTSPSAGNVTATSADLSWTNNSSATNFSIEYGPQGFTPGTGTFVTASAIPFTLNGLNQNTNYSFYVRALCSSTDSSLQVGPASFLTPLVNDLPAGAILLTVGAGCTGNPYSNDNATQTTNEPFASCRGTNGFHSVWFKFIAPASGFVRVTNDYSGATIGSTRIAVFNTTDPSVFSAFSIQGCDDNNASTVAGKSLLYLNGLTPGATYYVDVDGVGSGQAQGTFCLTVDEVDASMIASAGACTAGHARASQNSAYLNWLSLVDANGKLIANVRQTNAASTSPTGYTSSININTGSVRQNGTQYYHDRNFMINTSGTTSSPSYDVQFYFLNTELTALQNVDASATLGNINVTRQANSTCQATFSIANGTVSQLIQTGNGSSTSGFGWVQVPTPGFSNFYLVAGAVPLSIKLANITAVRAAGNNLVHWSTSAEDAGDKFTLQKSPNGSDYTDITEVAANGKASEYDYTDRNAVTGKNYYRLKLSGRDGSNTISKTVVVDAGTAKGHPFSVYPNPVKDVLNVLWSNSQATTGDMQIADVLGRVVKLIPAGQTRIDVADLPQGIYTLRLISGAEVSETVRFEKM